MSINKRIIIIVGSLILVVLIAFISYWMYAAPAMSADVNCRGTIKVLYLEDSGIALEELEKSFNFDDVTTEAIINSPIDYRYIVVDNIISNNSEETFTKLRSEVDIKGITVVGTPFMPEPEVSYLSVYPGENEGILIYFLVKAEEKTDEEILTAIKEGKIYIKASAKLIANPKWEVNIS